MGRAEVRLAFFLISLARACLNRTLGSFRLCDWRSWTRDGVRRACRSRSGSTLRHGGTRFSSARRRLPGRWPIATWRPSHRLSGRKPCSSGSAGRRAGRRKSPRRGSGSLTAPTRPSRGSRRQSRFWLRATWPSRADRFSTGGADRHVQLHLARDGDGLWRIIFDSGCP